MANILIADDMAIIRLTMRNFLERAGHSVVGEAKNGDEAVRLYRALSASGAQVDLAALNLTMPVADGLSATEQILEINPAAKCVIVSAVTTQTAIVEAIVRGASHYIAKPLEEAAFIRVINEVLSSAALAESDRLSADKLEEEERSAERERIERIIQVAKRKIRAL